MILNFTIFDIATHEIVGRVSHIPRDGVPDGHEWIAGDYDDVFYKIDPHGGEGEDEDGNHVWIPVPYLKEAPLSQSELIRKIVRHRAELLSTGFEYDFGDARGVHRIGTTEQDERGWDKVTKIAQALINKGLPDGEIAIVTDTGPVMVTASEWQDVLIAASEFQQPIYQKSFELQAMTPIPQNVTAAEWWS